MKIRETLQRRNHDVKQDLDQIVALVSRTQIPVELEPYRIAFLARTRLLLNSCRENLALLSTGEDSLLADVLSETSTLVQYTRLLKFRYLRGLYRAMDWDRVCLRTITWLHKEHEQTKDYPAVFADDDVSIVPSKGLPFYFFPCLEQRGLRFQPLFFHEFGHLLYKCHESELDSLVGDFQQFVESELLPVSQRNDQYRLWRRGTSGSRSSSAMLLDSKSVAPVFSMLSQNILPSSNPQTIRDKLRTCMAVHIPFPRFESSC